MSKDNALHARPEKKEPSRKTRVTQIPSNEIVAEELKNTRYKSRFAEVLRGTLYSLIVVAAMAVLVATIWLPVFRIYGSSMTPTLNEGDIVITVKGTNFKTGDVVGLYVGNRLLVKRIIAGPGQWVDIKDDGTVYLDDKLLDEPYLTEKALGDCNIELPYQVPDARYFVMGDHRSTLSLIHISEPTRP